MSSIIWKFLHDIGLEASFALLTCTLMSRYPIPFWIDRAISAGEVGNFAHFCHKIGCHGNVPYRIGKTGPDQENSRKYLLFPAKIVEIGPEDEIASLIVKKRKLEMHGKA